MSLNQLKTKLEEARQQYYDAEAKMRQAETVYNEAVRQDECDKYIAQKRTLIINYYRLVEMLCEYGLLEKYLLNGFKLNLNGFTQKVIDNFDIDYRPLLEKIYQKYNPTVVYIGNYQPQNQNQYPELNLVFKVWVDMMLHHYTHQWATPASPFSDIFNSNPFLKQGFNNYVASEQPAVSPWTTTVIPDVTPEPVPEQPTVTPDPIININNFQDNIAEMAKTFLDSPKFDDILKHSQRLVTENPDMFYNLDKSFQQLGKSILSNNENPFNFIKEIPTPTPSETEKKVQFDNPIATLINDYKKLNSDGETDSDSDEPKKER
jgi:hypothetical protein